MVSSKKYLRHSHLQLQVCSLHNKSNEVNEDVELTRLRNMGFLNDFVREIEYAFDPNNGYWDFGRIAIIFVTMCVVLSVINCVMIQINRRR